MHLRASILLAVLSAPVARAQEAPRAFTASTVSTDTVNIVGRVVGSLAIRAESLIVTVDSAVFQNYDELHPHTLGGLTLLLLSATRDGSWAVWRESVGLELHVHLPALGAVRFPAFRQALSLRGLANRASMWPALQLLDGEIAVPSADTTSAPSYSYIHLPYTLAGGFRPAGLPFTASRHQPALLPNTCAEEPAPAVGAVLLEYIVDTSGVVEYTSFRVLRATDSALVRSAVRSVARCWFVPGGIGAEPIPVRVRELIRFQAHPQCELDGDSAGVSCPASAAASVDPATSRVIAESDSVPAGVYLVTAVDEQPQTVPGSCMAPQYPDSLLRTGVEGRVVLQFIVDSLGRAERPSLRVLRSSQPGFEAAARATVLTCRYHPGRVAGRPVRVRIAVPINFTVSR